MAPPPVSCTPPIAATASRKQDHRTFARPSLFPTGSLPIVATVAPSSPPTTPSMSAATRSSEQAHRVLFFGDVKAGHVQASCGPAHPRRMNALRERAPRVAKAWRISCIRKPSTPAAERRPPTGVTHVCRGTSGNSPSSHRNRQGRQTARQTGEATPGRAR